jgi:GT2 family glycosyltransferase
MISIITAVHNQLAHNRLYLESIRRYSSCTNEIIIVDNHSTDGSGDFFEKNGCVVIRNEKNFCYSEAMNQGIAKARHDYLCFLNNDVWVGVNWDRNLIDVMNEKGLDIVSPMGIERRRTMKETTLAQRQWNRIGRIRHLKATEKELLQLVEKMYGNWEAFCANFSRENHDVVIDGIVGNCVLARRSAMEKIGFWDPRFHLGADWDICLKTLKRARDYRDIQPIRTVGRAYIHHFLQATLKNRPEPFACTHPRLDLYDKWDRKEVISLWPFPQEVLDAPVWYRSPLKYLEYKYKKFFLRYDWGDPY